MTVARAVPLDGTGPLCIFMARLDLGFVNASSE